MRRFLMCSILVLLASALVLPFAALRPPTAAEKLVLEKYESVINKTLDQFQSGDWDENVDYSVNEDVAVGTNAGRPLDVDELFQRTYRVRNGSEPWNQVVGPQMAKIQEEPDPAKKMRIGQQLQSLTAVEVEVHFNSVVSIDAPPPGTKSYLQVPGTAMAYHATTNPFNHGAAYVLLFRELAGNEVGCGQKRISLSFCASAEYAFYRECCDPDLWGG